MSLNAPLAHATPEAQGGLNFVKPDDKRSVQADRRRRSPLYRIKTAQSDEGVVQATQDLFRMAVRAREPVARRWSEYYDWARGNQWSTSRPKWRSKAQANYLFSSIFSKTSTLTDSRPLVRALPRSPEDTALVDGWINPFLSWIWDRNNMDEQFMETMATAMIFGTSFIKPFWNPSLDNGRGFVDSTLVDPAFIWPDPGGRDERDVEFLYHAEPTSIEQIERLFPREAGRVRPESVNSGFFSARDRSAMFGGTHIPLDKKIPIFGRIIDSISGKRRQQVEPGIDIDRAMVVEAWIRQNEEIEVTDQTGKSVSIAFPHGRHIVYANDVLLVDEPNDMPFFPFVRFRDYIWPQEFWGGGEVEQLRELQEEMNLHRARIADHMKWFGNGQIIMDKGAVDSPDLLTNAPNAVIEKNPGKEFRREQPLPLPKSSTDFVDILQRDFENLSGNQPANQQGGQQGSIRSGVALEVVAEAANTRTRLTERLAQNSLKRWASIVIATAKERMTEDTIFRLTNDQTGVTEFRRIKPEDLWTQLDFEASVGSQILKGRQRYSVTDALLLFQNGLIDERAMLDVTEFPEAEVVLQRVKKLREEQQGMGVQNADPNQLPPNVNGIAPLQVIPGGGG